jgi:hypothetical protein
MFRPTMAIFREVVKKIKNIYGKLYYTCLDIKLKIHVLRELYDKMFIIWNILSYNLFNTYILALYLYICNIISHNYCFVC